LQLIAARYRLIGCLVIHLPGLSVELVVSNKYRFSVDSIQYATKMLKLKDKNHNYYLRIQKSEEHTTKICPRNIK